MDARTLTEQVLKRCELLSHCTDVPGQVHRLFLSSATRAAHRYLTDWMKEAGLEVRVDPIGNVRGIKRSKNPQARTFLVASHIDTVPNAGKYDGTLGVLMGIALAGLFRAEDLQHHLEIVAFSEEEGVRFQQPFLGSSVLAGTFQSDWLKKKDFENQSLSETLFKWDLDQNRIPIEAFEPRELLGYLEIHIEQGPVLADQNLPVGVVSGIVGQSRLNLTFLGQAGHAGTTPMPLRKDALTGAAEFICWTEEYALSNPGLVATVGKVEVRPNTSNVIPEQVTVSLDVRHLSDEKRVTAVQELLHQAHMICQKRNLGLQHEFPLDQQAVICEDRFMEALLDACKFCGLPEFTLPSGAGHDAMVLAKVTDIAMLFVRSPNAISHHPSETVEPEDVEAALKASGHFLSQILR
ncbi:allantoate amidohydrolase [Deinococcus roseus]|uniref:Zn-dependent hydrolase n=1 Tax=Deinococcus roseus TaxID=392414 RepID=A0ABQ2D0H3_9DEIO|nr:allantoate amidohydrolase [Deinococcus roseus]GGJ38902.1 Zn-dependent hydrolase [Deinococcus roseus]